MPTTITSGNVEQLRQFADRNMTVAADRGQFKVSNNNVFHRLITWVHSNLRGASQSRQNSATREKFVAAIGDRYGAASGTAAGEVLSAGRGKPLRSHDIKQVFAKLDQLGAQRPPDAPTATHLAHGPSGAHPSAPSTDAASNVATPLAADPLKNAAVPTEGGDVFNDPLPSTAIDRSWTEEVLQEAMGENYQKYLEASVGTAAKAAGKAEGKAEAPATAPDHAGVPLPANFDSAGAIGRLDEEIAMQEDEIRRYEGQAEQNPEDLGRLHAERDARMIARDAITSGLDPRGPLRARMQASTDQYGSADLRTQAFNDTLIYFDEARVFAEATTGDGKVPDSVDTSGVLSGWRGLQVEVQNRSEQLVPRSSAEIQRAEAFEEVNSFIQQAIAVLSTKRDPRPELIRHAVSLEGTQFEDGNSGKGEASMLRVMAEEYTDLLQESAVQ